MLRAAGGDEKAFERLFHTYKYKLFGYIYTLTGSSGTAEDTVQEVFLKLWKNKAGLAEIDNLGAYIFRMAQHHAINGYRKMARETLLIAEMGREIAAAPVAEDILAVKELEEKLKRAVELLPRQQKLAYTLSREQGLKHEEIARQMEISPGTVKNHIIQALRTLRDELGRHPGAAGATAWLLLFAASLEK